MAENEGEELPILLPCGVCCRTFRPEVLEKHARICEKTAAKKRKAFDSAQQRIHGTDLAEFLPAAAPAEKTPAPARKPGLAPRKKQQREPGARPRDERPAVARPLGSERCPHCDRLFGPKSFDRHVEWCKEQSTRIPKSPAASKAKERLEARIKYRAPAVRSQRAVTREKYSPLVRKASGRLQDFSPSAGYGSNASLATTVSSVSAVARAPASSPRPMRANSVFEAVQRVSVRQRSASPSKRTPLIRTRSLIERTGQQPPPVILGGKEPPRAGRARTAAPPSSGDQESRSRFPRVLRGNFTTPNLPNFTVILGDPAPSEDGYDPYVFAERQMMELLSHVSSRRVPEVVRPTPMAPAALATSPTSAFTKYSAPAGPEVPPPGGDAFRSLSLLPSSPASRMRTKYRAKLERAALSLKRSVSLFRPPAEGARPQESPPSPGPCPDGGDGTEDEELLAHTAGLKISADSAYSSLNRRSPRLSRSPEQPASSAPDTDLRCPSPSGSETSLPQLCPSQVGPGRRSPPQPPASPQNCLAKLSKFCHECGTRYPVSIAKFCCECGVRRLVV
ncbi:zinc finger C2HC domain-containing protein 1A-like [Bacillus rossius redtenbacheri]|uniref:zinc finger C2HC domain-containing protein 1A-like n=1 Tax=Bacillus rossius redtenbacheri TaxID=93214 RepID=UPI002FDCAC5C